MICKKCGTKLEKGSNYCSNCGSNHISKGISKIIIMVLLIVLTVIVFAAILVIKKNTDEAEKKAFMKDAEKCVSVLNHITHNDYNFEFGGTYYLYYKKVDSYSFDSVLFPYEIVDAELCAIVPSDESYEYEKQNPTHILEDDSVERIINYSSEEEIKEPLYEYMTKTIINSEFNSDMLFIDDENKLYLKSEYKNGRDGDYYDLNTLRYYQKKDDKRYVLIEFYSDYELDGEYRITFKEYDGKWKICNIVFWEDE